MRAVRGTVRAWHTAGQLVEPLTRARYGRDTSPANHSASAMDSDRKLPRKPASYGLHEVAGGGTVDPRWEI